MRQSLDSARFPRHPHHQQRPLARKLERAPPTPEESFEDVGLDDQKQQPRKRGFFSKLTDMQDKESAGNPGQQSMSRFLIGGRKRGQSGQGAELGSMDQPTTTTGEEHQHH